MTFSFKTAMKSLPDIPSGGIVAAAVSGGPDSMALLWLLSEQAQENNFSVHAYTVDHGLRAESADEAKRVAGWITGWPCVSHRILQWTGEKPDARILEEARAARYSLIADAMKAAGAKYLFVGHHQDDQAETFLFRLAKGSGLDGLSGMRHQQKLESGITILRPLLEASKEDLLEMCHDNKIPFVEDPTNNNEKYLRPRLRAAREILEEEGLSSKRLAVTAARIARARDALDDLAHDLFTMAVMEQADGGIALDWKTLHAAHEELSLRAVLSAMDKIHHDRAYGPRLERVEKLLDRILHDPDFRGATLGGCIFTMDSKRGRLWIRKE